MDLQRALDTAVRAARVGGEVARARLGKPGYLKWKGMRDVTSESSLEAQQAIIATLERESVDLGESSDFGIFAEEGPDDAAVPLDAKHLWIVDPICGSLNFVQGIPYFAISIALRSQGDIQVGVVYDPCNDELFQATTETAATRNGEKIVVQQISEGLEAWSAAIIGTDWPRSGERREHSRIISGLMMDQVAECNVMGSPALGLCNVAAGRYHAYWHLDLKIWDIAAASLIVQRAGGTLTDALGNTWLYSDGGYIATNGIIHGWLLNCIHPILQPSE